MKATVILLGAAAFFAGRPAPAQQTAPIYRVTVIERTTKAINYQYRAGPTKIDFRGTVLMPTAKGEATVESRRGRTEIESRFENVVAPTRFGHEYLTYVLWAITPEGASRNLGEVVPNGSDKARLHVTSDLQAFGLIVTAEPYGAVRRPSDVVVMENQVRADTVGKVTEIAVKHELMPRGHFTWEVPERLQAGVSSARKVSMDEYEAQLHIYEAENAIGIARSAGAAQYAADTLAQAQRLLAEAQRLNTSKGRTHAVVENAREAAQTAEDARAIAEQRSHQQAVAAAEADAAAARRGQSDAQAATQRALAEATAARAQADAERAAREQAEAAAAEARRRAAHAEAAVSQPAAPPPPPQDQASAQKTTLRLQLLQQLNGILPVRDTPRGLVATLPASAYNASAAQLARIAAVVAPYPGIRVDVEGHSDSAADEAAAANRAETVRQALLESGLPAARVAARGFGDSRPLGSNATAAGREENRRVEIVISGAPLGDLAAWDHTYRLTVGR